jgi:hypothetical protein
MRKVTTEKPVAMPDKVTLSELLLRFNKQSRSLRAVVAGKLDGTPTLTPCGMTSSLFP